jgi:hypothetical protein
VPKLPKRRADLFLNIPYDKEFKNLYLAYIAGICAFGLLPRATLEIPGGARRLDRIFHLIQGCRYAVHDLSRVELDPHRPCTPVLTCASNSGFPWLGSARHVWFVFEKKERRLMKSLSDLNGTDAYIHHGGASGVFRELSNALVRRPRQPSVLQMRRVYEQVKKNIPAIFGHSGTQAVFQASVFKQICVFATAASESVMRRSRQ